MEKASKPQERFFITLLAACFMCAPIYLARAWAAELFMAEGFVTLKENVLVIQLTIPNLAASETEPESDALESDHKQVFQDVEKMRGIFAPSSDGNCSLVSSDAYVDMGQSFFVSWIFECQAPEKVSEIQVHGLDVLGLSEIYVFVPPEGQQTIDVDSTAIFLGD